MQRKKMKEKGYPCFFSGFTIVGPSNELQEAAKTPVVILEKDSEKKRNKTDISHSNQIS